MTADGGALAGVRVLDLADESAVLGARLLADLGADVLRPEPPAGDPIRRLGPFAEDRIDPEFSLSHWWFNAGKRSAIVDPATDAGRATIARLAPGADVVIETGGWPFDAAAARRANPALTVVSVRPFGLSGPHRDWQAGELVTWAVGGGMSTTGLPGRPPLHSNWLIAHQVAGLYAGIGALAGLHQARQTGRGTHFDLSRQEALASILTSPMPFYVYDNGRIQGREGLANPILSPYRDFDTRDGRVIFIALTQGQWQSLVDWLTELGVAEPWLQDPDLVPATARSIVRAKIHAWLENWLRTWTTADLVREANRRRIPCAAINLAPDVLQDEQMRARGFFVPVDQPSLGRAVEYPGLPYQFPDNGAIRAAPRLGADAAGWRGERPPPAPQFWGEPDVESGERADPAPVASTSAGEPTASAAIPAAPARLSTLGEPNPPSAVSSPPPELGGAGGGPEPLSGVNVLDLTWALAGPAGARVIADLGADLIKVEARDIGDVLRSFGPFWGGKIDYNASGHLHRIVRNRRSITIDLKQAAGIALVKRLAQWADVVVDNFGAGVMDRLGLGWAELAALKPDLIQVSLSGYGQTGPTRNYPSFAAISEARGGLVAATAYADGTIAGPSIWLGDTGAGLQLAFVILACLEQRRQTGRGTYVDMSQLEAATLFVGPAWLEASVNGRAMPPAGNQLPDRIAAPHDVYPAAPGEGPGDDDRWVAIAVETENQWQRLAAAIGRPELTDDPRFADLTARAANRAALDEAIAAWTRQHDAHAIAERLQAAGVPAGVVQTARDLLELDPHLAARGFYQRVDQPGVGPVPIDTLPLRWGDGPTPVRRPAPLVGEHTESILREELGLSEAEYVQLVIDEVV